MGTRGADKQDLICQEQAQEQEHEDSDHRPTNQENAPHELVQQTTTEEEIRETQATPTKPNIWAELSTEVIDKLDDSQQLASILLILEE